MPYIHFTKEQTKQARETDICDILRRQGEETKKSGSERVWRDGYDKVTIRGNLWYHQYDMEGGDAIDFVRRFMNMSYPEAMQYLLGETGGVFMTAAPVEKEPTKPFELPKKNDNMRRVFAYLLTKRGLDKDVVCDFARNGMIYESAEYHNAVFVGFDSGGRPLHAHMRGTGSESTYKGNQSGSLPEFSFHWHGTSDSLYVFEAPIDMLSYISMHKDGWQQHSYAACCGVGDRVAFQMLKDNPHIKRMVLCFDNDEAGLDATKRTAQKLYTKRITAGCLVPKHKDWNEDLLCQDEEPEQEQNEEDDLCPTELRLSS